MGDRHVKITGNGKRLDFHIAYYLGQLALKEPEAFFHIVSRDAGFDPLIQHLKAHKILACRSVVSEIPILKTAAPKTLADRVSLVNEDLKRRKASKPRLANAEQHDQFNLPKATFRAPGRGDYCGASKQGVLAINGTKAAIHYQTKQLKNSREHEDHRTTVVISLTFVSNAARC